MAKIIDTQYDEMYLYTLCNKCPCLNNDYEQGCSCNLNYDTDYIELKDTGYANVSINCGMLYISYFIEKEENEGCAYEQVVALYAPETVYDCQVHHTYEYTETEKTMQLLLKQMSANRMAEVSTSMKFMRGECRNTTNKNGKPVSISVKYPTDNRKE